MKDQYLDSLVYGAVTQCCGAGLKALVSPPRWQETQRDGYSAGGMRATCYLPSCRNNVLQGFALLEAFLTMPQYNFGWTIDTIMQMVIRARSVLDLSLVVSAQ